MALAQVIELNNKSNNIVNYIKLYLDRKANKSIATADNYKRHIKYFFNALYGVDDIDYITDDMLQSLDVIKTQSYFQDMINNETYASATIANKLSAIKDLFSSIINDYICDVYGNVLLKFNPLATFKYSPKSNEYGAFTLEEAFKIIECAEKDNPEIALYYAIMLQTGVRPNAVRNQTLNTISCKNGEHFIEGIDKCNKPFSVKIEECLYKKCVELSDSEGVFFHFGEHTALNKLSVKTTYKPNGNIKTNYNKTYCNAIGIDEETCKDRILVLHSFRKTIATEACSQGANLGELMRILHHSNPKTAQKYINKVKRGDNDDNTKYVSFENKQTLNDKLKVKLNTMSKDDIINMIMQMDEVTKNRILNVEA